MIHQPEKPWHSLDVNEVLAALKASREGLSQKDAESRLAEFGPNELVKKKKISPWLIFLGQFNNFLIIILIIAVVLSAILGDILEAGVILVILFFAAGLGFIQEYRAERVLEALKKMAAPKARVQRNGEILDIPSKDLVPGDILILHTGDRVPADSRLLEAVNLKTNEASLTGESLPVEKELVNLSGEVILGDRKNMIYTGTTVVYGRGRAVVALTGMNTEFGKIAGMLEEVKSAPTPLQVSLDKMARWIGIGALGLCSLLALAGIIKGQPPLEMLIWAIGLAVAAVPEALPAVVTISLAIGVQRMVKRNALIRKLPAVETLGCTTIICSDKTGTLTQDQMTVKEVYADNRIIEVTGTGYVPDGQFLYQGEVFNFNPQSTLYKLLEAGVLCNDTYLSLTENVWSVKGDPTEGALVVLAAKADIDKTELNSRFPRAGEIPFSSERKRMTTVHYIREKKDAERSAYSKGAAEIILKPCSHIYDEGKIRELKEEDKEKILSTVQHMAARALRVLGIAFKGVPFDIELAEQFLEKDMVFIGLVGMMDPPRQEAFSAIKLCKEAGIKITMITGDHKLTAEGIARSLQLLDEKGISLSGVELDKLSEAEFDEIAEKVEVYARVSPSHKLRIVEKLSQHGHVVAMTGDGVNDAPALKRADIGIAMGITGTDVTKEAADMVLTDDNFASIVSAIEEGRGVFDNIKKFLTYLISCNIGEILIVAIGVLFSAQLGVSQGALLLTVIQILYINLATDGLPALALSMEPIEPHIMKRKPRPRQEGVFSRDVLLFFAAGGIWSAVICIGVFLWALKTGKPFSEAQSMCFVSLILVQFINAFNLRSLDRSVFALSPFTNKWLLLAIAWEILMLILIIYQPFLSRLFGTYPLTLRDWAVIVFSSITILVVLEIVKYINHIVFKKMIKEES